MDSSSMTTKQQVVAGTYYGRPDALESGKPILNGDRVVIRLDSPDARLVDAIHQEVLVPSKKKGGRA